MTAPNAYGDPIERFTAEVQVYGMRQLPGQPQQTEAFFHVRRRQDGAMEAAMGLPAYKGNDGAPGNPPVVYLVNTFGEIPSAGSLTMADAGKGWRIAGETDVRFWTGTAFVLHPDWLGVEGDAGPAGPANTLTPGSISMLSAGATPTMSITGVAPNQVLSLGIPAQVGPAGPTGPAAAIEASTDYNDDAVAATVGQVLGKRGDGKWGPIHDPNRVREFVTPSTSFPTVTKIASDVRHQIVAVPIPAQPFNFRVGVAGACDVLTAAGHRVEFEVRLEHPETGALIGVGRVLEDTTAGLWHEATFRSYSADAFAPGSSTGVIASGTAVTVYLSAVLKSGFSADWQLRPDFAQLRLTLLGAT